MKKSLSLQQVSLRDIALVLLPLFLFWGILFVEIPYSWTRYLSPYYSAAFLIVLVLYCLCFRLPEPYSTFASLLLSMSFFALALSYNWTSGYSDNMMFGGLLPYKDARNYYQGANLILNGLPMVNVSQATERPLFPGFLSTILLLTDQNLKIAMGVITQVAAVGLYLSARQIRNALGILAASLYITLMFFYIEPFLGRALSEILGFMLGCFAFSLLWRASFHLKWLDLILGLATLLIAVSARAGAFFIFPMLVLWIGWIFRGESRFSMKAAIYALAIVVVGYFFLNSLYSQLLGIPPGSAFGNFSYAIYGQVRGGTGWHSAIDELGTRNPAIVYRAALQFFLKHPLSLAIGFAKAYRDFFLPGDRSIFSFQFYGWQNFSGVIIWIALILLLLRGLLRIFINIRVNNSSLMLAGFLGVFLSIPFLPPIDGGARFYASTMPFFFILPALGVDGLIRKLEGNSSPKNDLEYQAIVTRFSSVAFMIFTLVLPVALYTIGQKLIYTTPSCPPQQKSFVIESHPGSYIDLIRDGVAQCGIVPEVCLSDFEKNNTEKSIDDYYQKLISLAESEETGIRIIPASNLIDQKFHYFFIPYRTLLIDSSHHLMSGCATKIETQNQSIYYVESILSDEK